MSIKKRAGLYVIRHKVKSLILLLTLTIIATLILTGIAIQSSASAAAKDVRGAVSGKITLDIDMSSKNMQSQQTQWGYANTYVGDRITSEVIAAMREIPGVTEYNMTDTMGFMAAAKNFNFLPAAFNMQTTKYGDNGAMTATLFSEKFSGFTSGKLTLESGRHITDEDSHVILISDELAEHNGLSVGDKLELYTDYAGTYPEMTVEVEIIGIFSGTRGTSEGAFMVSMIPGNQGIVDMETSSVINYGEVAGALEIYVEDPINIQNVYDRIASHPVVKGKTFTLAIDAQEFDVIANPLESLQSLVRTLIIVISTVSVAILALLLTIWTRGRVRETGILMSIGINKSKIIGQFILETVFIAILAFGLAYPASSLIADKTGEFIMAQVASSQNLQDDDSQIDDGSFSFSADDFDMLSGKPSAENATWEINVTITPNYLIWVYGVGTLLIVCAVLIASYTIIRLKPREILSKYE